MGGSVRAVLVASLIALSAIALGAVPASGATTFGADLGAAPSNTATCGDLGGASCTFFSGAPGPSFYAPQSGTVTAVRVRVGPVTGPMQVLVMRSLYQNKYGEPGRPYFACCFVERYGPVFTPAANSLTTVPTQLPMTEEPVPPAEDFTTNAAGDFLALSVLSSAVPVPLIANPSSPYVYYLPALTEADTPAPSPVPSTAAGDGFGGEPALNADLETGGAAAPAPGGAPAPAATVTPAKTLLPELVLSPGVFPLRHGAVTLPVQCLRVACSGSLTLQNRRLAGAAAAKRARTVSYGGAHFSLAAGKQGHVKVKLNRAGRALFAHGRRRARVWANVSFTAGGAPHSAAVTLRRP